MKKAFLLVPLCVLPAFAADDASTPAPHETVLTSVRALRDNDLSALLHASMTEQDFAQLAAEWDQERKTAPDPQEAFQYQLVMGMLTAPGAEEQLMSQLEPKLEELRPQISMFVPMIAGMAEGAIAEQKDMTPEERADATRILEQMSLFLMENDVCDPALAKKAVGIVCSAARRMELDSLEDVQALSFEELLAKADIALAASKGVLTVYGLDVDAFLSSVNARTVSQTEDRAVVEVSYEFLGVEDTSEVELVLVDGQWIQEDASEVVASR
jgi:hypothetical protein